jgi:hypothetical protein
MIIDNDTGQTETNNAIITANETINNDVVGDYLSL